MDSSKVIGDFLPPWQGGCLPHPRVCFEMKRSSEGLWSLCGHCEPLLDAYR